MARFGQTSIGSPEHSVHSAGGCTTPTHAPPRVPFLQRRITNPMSDQTPTPGPAPHPHPQEATTIKGSKSNSSEQLGKAAAARRPLPVPTERYATGTTTRNAAASGYYTSGSHSQTHTQRLKFALRRSSGNTVR